MGGGKLDRKAFTLIEIIGGIVLVGIIALITVPAAVRVVKETKRRSFYTAAEGIVKATFASMSKHEEEYDAYFLENESITFKFSKSEGKEGESVEEVNGKKIKLSFEGKSPVGGEVRLYKDGDIEVVNLTDGTYYANKDTDTEIEVSETTTTLTRGQLQAAVESLQKEVIELKAKDKALEETNKSQDTAINTNKDNIETNKTNIEKLTTIVNNINTSMLSKTYPVGSIYISTNSTNPSSIFGGTWERYGEGRTLVGVNTSDANFNTVSKTGGVSTNTLTTDNLPAHTHSIPALSGGTNEVGSHTHSFSGTTSENGGQFHKIYTASGTQQAYWFTPAGSYANPSSYAWSGWPSEHLHTHTYSGKTDNNGNHTHTLTTNANTTGSVGKNTVINNLSPYITVYMWKRVA